MKYITNLYNDDEAISIDQAVADFINVPFRGMDCDSIDMVAAARDFLLDMLQGESTPKQKAYIQKLIELSTLQIQLAEAYKDAIEMGSRDEYQIDSISKIKTIIDDDNVLSFSTNGLEEWSQQTIFHGIYTNDEERDYTYLDGRQPQAYDTALITIGSLLHLLVNLNNFGDENDLPKISTIAHAIKMEDGDHLEYKGKYRQMFGQKYDNLRKLFRKALKTRAAFIDAHDYFL